MKQKNDTNKVLGTIRLSMSDYVKTLAQARAGVIFSGNVSAYIAYLILKDCESQQSGASTASDNNIGNGNILSNSPQSKIKQKIKKELK